MTTFFPIKPTRPKRRLAPYKSYDKSRGKTPGLLSSRHDPIAAERLDRLEFARCLPRTMQSRQAAALIVFLSHTNHPTITHAKKTTPITFPKWDRLSQQEKWALYAMGSVEAGIPLNKAVTLHLRSEEIYLAQLKGYGPARLVGSIINAKLEPIYRRAKLHLSYAYKIEVEQAYDPDHKVMLCRRETDRVDFHATILLHVPDALVEKVEEVFAAYAATTRQVIRQYHTGKRAHIADIGMDRQWNGKNASRRRGLLGKADYAGKDFHKLDDVAGWEKQHYASPLDLRKLCHASTDVVATAKALYTELVSWLTLSGPEAIDRAKGLPSAFSAFAVNEIETVERIASTRPDILDMMKRVQTDEDAVSYLAGGSTSMSSPVLPSSGSDDSPLVRMLKAPVADDDPTYVMLKAMILKDT
ncbi:hypothetical protein [Paramagnetospirillum caucaseum]|nr:hypothetical protein [Paramagnetospirillum caucaseum]